MLLAAVGVIFLLATRFTDPAFLRGLGHLFGPPQATDGVTSIDNRLEPAAPDALLAGGFAIAQENPGEASPESPKPAEPGFLPGICREDFDTLRDDAPSTRGERACSLRVLDILNRTDEKTLERASVGPVTYAQLFRQSGEYRGRLVSVSGVVRRATRVELFPNDYGLKQYYQVWLWPTDNPGSPTVVYCLELPERFPVGMEMAEQAEVTGVFFKRWPYLAKNDALRTAPALLAKTFAWQHRPVMAPAPTVRTWMIPLVVTATAMLALLAAWVVYLRTRSPRQVLPAELPRFDREEETLHED